MSKRKESINSSLMWIFISLTCKDYSNTVEWYLVDNLFLEIHLYNDIDRPSIMKHMFHYWHMDYCHKNSLDSNEKITREMFSILEDFLDTYITEHALATWITRTDKSIDSIDTLSTSARFSGTIINIDFTHITCKTRQALACITIRFSIVVHYTSAIICTRCLTQTRIDPFRTCHTWIPRWTQTRKLFYSINTRCIRHTRIGCTFIDLYFTMNTCIGRWWTNTIVTIDSISTETIDTRWTQTIID